MADVFSKGEPNNAASGEANNPGCAYFGDGVKFKGSITVPEKIVVHGSVEGDVESRELFVGPDGVIKGNVRVDEADVEGTILENIEAKLCLSLRKTGRIEGKAVYGEIEIEKGGVLSGEVASISSINNDPSSKNKATASIARTDRLQLQPTTLKKTSERVFDNFQMGSAEEIPQLGSGTKSDVKKEKQDKPAIEDASIRK